jgi:hypothetical protein
MKWDNLKNRLQASECCHMSIERRRRRKLLNKGHHHQLQHFSKINFLLVSQYLFEMLTYNVGLRLFWRYCSCRSNCIVNITFKNLIKIMIRVSSEKFVKRFLMKFSFSLHFYSRKRIFWNTFCLIHLNQSIKQTEKNLN